jgi:hypothetical protein
MPLVVASERGGAQTAVVASLPALPQRGCGASVVGAADPTLRVPV